MSELRMYKAIVRPASAQIEDNETIVHFRQLAMEMSGGATPSPQDEFLFGLTYKEYFNLSEEEAAALWNEAYAEESAKLDHEPELEAKSNVCVCHPPECLSVFVTGRS